MKKRYENPICDLFVVEEQLMGNVNSNTNIGTNTDEDLSDELPFDPSVDNGSGGGGTEITDPDMVGAKGTNPIFDF